MIVFVPWNILIIFIAWLLCQCIQFRCNVCSLWRARRNSSASLCFRLRPRVICSRASTWLPRKIRANILKFPLLPRTYYMNSPWPPCDDKNRPALKRCTRYFPLFSWTAAWNWNAWWAPPDLELPLFRLLLPSHDVSCRDRKARKGPNKNLADSRLRPCMLLFASESTTSSVLSSCLGEKLRNRERLRCGALCIWQVDEELLRQNLDCGICKI